MLVIGFPEWCRCTSICVLFLVVALFEANESLDGPDAKEKAQDAEAERVEAFLKRKADGSTDARFRPQKRHRKAAAKFLRDLDNQVHCKKVVLMLLPLETHKLTAAPMS